MTVTQRPTRAAPLPPDERRAAIIEATLPLLVERGTNITTRQIADAAGIAEGTIFRVFPDKDSLLRAAIDAAFDTSPTEAAIRAIDPALPFEQRLEEAVVVIQRRALEIWRLVSVIADDAALRGSKRRRPVELRSLVALFGDARAEIRDEPARAARTLRSLTIAVSHPAFFGDEPMTPREIVELFLDGVRARTADRMVKMPTEGGRSC
jgi:AcrR family transcriptional regulator